MATKDILDPNPFANPISAKNGNASAAEIYTAVGFALDRWEHCDTMFGVLYSALAKPEGGNHILMRSFGMINSAKSKEDMIKSACDAYFAENKHPKNSQNEDLKKQVRHWLKLYGDAAARRNEIAHAMVMGEMRHKVVNKVALVVPTGGLEKLRPTVGYQGIASK